MCVDFLLSKLHEARPRLPLALLALLPRKVLWDIVSANGYLLNKCEERDGPVCNQSPGGDGMELRTHLYEHLEGKWFQAEATAITKALKQPP